MYKPMLFQINGGKELRTDVDNLKKAHEALQNKVVKDIVRIKMTATYAKEQHKFTVALPLEFDKQVPGADKAVALPMYYLDNTAVIDNKGEQITIKLSDLTMSGAPAKIDESASSVLQNGAVAYKLVTENFDFKCFPVGSFKLFDLPDNYLLDNDEMQLIQYDKALRQIVADLSQDQKLIDEVKKLVGEEAVASQINKVKEELNRANQEVSGKVTKIEAYVKDAGLDANNKKVVNVADATINENVKEAVNAGQVHAIKVALEAEDAKIKKQVTDLESNTSTNHTALSGRITKVEAYVKEAGLDANAKKIVNLAEGTIGPESKEAVCGKQIDAVNKAYVAADNVIKKSVTAVQEDLNSKNTAMNGRVAVVEGFVKATGIDAQNKKIVHVLDGTLAKDNKEAVNGGQLYAVKSVADVNKTKVEALEAKINDATISVKVPDYHVQEFTLAAEPQAEFVLEAKPNNVKVNVNVNGLVYEEGMEMFTVDRDQNKVIWTAADLPLKNTTATKVYISFVEDTTQSIKLIQA